MKRLLVGLALLALVVGVLWLSRGPITANRLEARLEELGFRCDDLEVEVAGDLTSASIAPFACTSHERAIERFALEVPVRVEREGLRARLVSVPSARIKLRSDAVRVDTQGETLAGGSQTGAVIVRMLRLFDMERAAHFEEVEIAVLEVALGGEGSLRILAEGIHAAPDGDHSVQIEVDTVRIPARGGTAVTFDDLSCTLEANVATIEGQVGGSAQLGRLELHREWRFRAHVTDLDAERPHLRFERVEDEE